MLVAAALLAACGRPHEPVLSEGQAPLPTLPPVAQRDPQAFDENGCLRTGPDAVDCATRASQIDAAQAGGGVDSWRSLAGFSGSQWNPAATSAAPGDLVVVSESVTVEASGTWRARGLVRNETSELAGAPKVQATLLDAGGEVIGVADASAMIPTLRPGEPAPFGVSSQVRADRVADVRWAVLAGDAPKAVSRDLELVTFWQRGFSDPRPVDLYLYQDPPEGPHPHLVFGSAINRGGGELRGVRVVGAWVDAEGRVLHTSEAMVPSEPSSALPGAGLDFLFVVNAGEASVEMDSAELYLWAWSA